jgi:hypothetical protein
VLPFFGARGAAYLHEEVVCQVLQVAAVRTAVNFEKIRAAVFVR